MNKRTLSIVLVVLAIISVAYSVYKATEPTLTTIENGRTIIYGQPQHGLTLGLCIFGGLCVLGAAILALDDRLKVTNTEGQTTATTTTTTGNRVATNYPR